MSVISIMKKAVKMNGSEYMFSLLFANHERGYQIHQINGVFTDDDMCTWNAYINENRVSSSNLLRCRVKDSQTLTFRYEMADGAVVAPLISLFD